MDAFLLQAVLPELRSELAGLPVTRVESAGKFGALIRFGGSRRNLWISAHPELSRIGLVDEPPTGQEPRPAPDNLSKPLMRSRLTDLEQEANGRVAVLHFENPEANHKSLRVVVELIPRFSNLILVGNDGRILWAKRDFTGDRPRQIAAGHRYEFPSAEAGVRFAALDAERLRERLASGEGPLHRRVPRGWGGGARGFARVLEAATPDEAGFSTRLLALAAASADPSPRIYREVDGPGVALFPADPGPLPGWQAQPITSANAVSDEYYRAREESDSSDSLLGDLRRMFVKRRGRAAKAAKQIERRLEDARREAEYRAHAELLTAHLAQVRRGMPSVDLPAFDGTGTVTIPLDPKKDGSGNAEALFKKARRLARGREELETQRDIQAAELAEVDRVLAEFDPEPSAERLRELAQEHAPSLLEGQRAAPGRGRPEARPSEDADARPTTLPDGFAPRVYFLEGGWEVWVGRNAKQNDELTHRRASQKDLWFHARGCQGSHTVLRISSGKGEPPREIVEAAAAIAAFHSKARKSKLVPVAYTEKRYVRRPRGAPAGTAAMMREKVLMVEPSVPEEAL